MLSAEDKAQYAAFGIDTDALAAAISNTAVVPMPYTPKSGEIKVGATTYHLYDTDGHNGLLGRVKNETLSQATELGIKALKTAAGVEFEGKDPAKFVEALTAKLKIPVDERLKEKERDIATMTDNWNTEKKNREAIEARLKDREETDRDISFFPENRVKIVKDSTLRAELKAQGITFGEHDGKPAVFVNGEVKKNTDLTLTDPKTFAAETFKANGWIAEAGSSAAVKKTLDVKDASQAKPAFDGTAVYEQIMQKHNGKWTPQAQSEYTNAIVAASGTSTATV